MSTRFSLPPAVRAKGRQTFIWRIGVRLIGVPAALITALLPDRHGARMLPDLSVTYAVHIVFTLLVVGIGGGYLLGAAIWGLSTRE